MIMLALLLQATPLDLSEMPIEDAVAIMFMMISEDAREDTRAMLAEMDETRQRRSGLREAEQDMARELLRLKALSKPAKTGSPNRIAQEQVAWANRLPASCGKLKAVEREACLVTQFKQRTSELRMLGHNRPPLDGAAE